ncbi:hypothetical protein BJX63DRAFT_438689 [Aspergillus granulosus]|uniref:Uncharacterized protein n=1 Tax=Aspergillus granulosus TaxID=176169 RepID=A0ABR4GR67_9EURO
MTSSRQSGPLVASTLAPQLQHELARWDLVMGLVQAWSARFPGLEPDVPSVSDQDGPINHRRVTYVPRVPDSKVGLANPGAAEALMSQFRRLHRLAGYDANVAVARVRGPTIADTTAIQ